MYLSNVQPLKLLYVKCVRKNKRFIIIIIGYIKHNSKPFCITTGELPGLCGRLQAWEAGAQAPCTQKGVRGEPSGGGRGEGVHGPAGGDVHLQLQPLRQGAPPLLPHQAHGQRAQAEGEPDTWQL